MSQQAETKVSVVIPCYNVELYIRECLDSVFRQSHSQLEVICVDDGSDDCTLSILKGYDRQITVLASDHTGATAARNRGLSSSTGKYIQFMDADDILRPQKIAHQVALLENNPNACLVSGAYERVQLDGKVAIKQPCGGDPWIALSRSMLGITSANLWRHSDVVEANGWNEKQRSSQEYELMFRLLQKNPNVVCDFEQNTIVRDRELGSIQIKNPTRMHLRWFRLRLAILNYLEQTDQLTRERKEAIGLAVIGKHRHLMGANAAASSVFYKRNFEDRLNLASNRQLSMVYKWSLSLLGFTASERIAQFTREYLGLGESL